MRGPIRNPRIVIIGGGGGTAAVYPEIARRTPNAVAALGVFDSGGSTGRLREELSLPFAVGDIRNVMFAASENPAILALRDHRFQEGDHLRGHHIGNLILAACVKEKGLDEGVELAAVALQVPGRILPVALQPAELVLRDGMHIIKGEHEIDVYRTTHAAPMVSLEPAVGINPRLAEAIKVADLVLIPGGSIYTSLLAALSVKGVREALEAARAPKVMLANLATDALQTHGWHVSDYVLALQRHGINPDIVLYNTAEASAATLANYAAEGSQPVDYSPGPFSRIPSVHAVGVPLLSREPYSHNPNDPIKRGLMRHDPQAVADCLWKIMAERNGIGYGRPIGSSV